MKLNLTPQQARVLGVLIEKQVTTPDQYPLTLNALTLGCNQKSSRDPVMELEQIRVQMVVGELQKLRLVRQESVPGSRVDKIQQRFCNTEFSERKLSPAELAIVCLLLFVKCQAIILLHVCYLYVQGFLQVLLS